MSETPKKKEEASAVEEVPKTQSEIFEQTNRDSLFAHLQGGEEESEEDEEEQEAEE